jgi:hypothetical protein
MERISTGSSEMERFNVGGSVALINFAPRRKNKIGTLLRGLPTEAAPGGP